MTPVLNTYIRNIFGIRGLPGVFFWPWLRKSYEELMPVYFPHTNVTVRMIALHVLQEHTSPSRISLCIEMICI